MTGSMTRAAQMRRGQKRREQQKRTGYVRPSRAKPKTGWTLAELSRMTATREGVLRRWMEMEIVPRPPFRGVATRYERQQLVWVLAVRRMQAMELAPLRQLKERLAAMSGERVEALAREACPPGAAAEALGIASATSTVAGLSSSLLPSGTIPAGAVAELPAGGPGVGRWTRIELGLGLELSVRDDASPGMRALAARIHSLCAGTTMRAGNDEPAW